MDAVMPEPRAQRSGESARERQVAAIISRGRSQRPGGWTAPALGALWALLHWAAFHPLDWGFLGWVCLAPVLLLARPPRRARWTYRSLLVIGFLMWLATLQWMRLGDPSMYLALFALAAYLALYAPVWLWLCRVATHRGRAPLLLVAPALWVGLEYLRAHLLTGFSWYYLGHTQHRWIDLIQISDLGGAYTVSFVVVLVNAALASLIPNRWLVRRGLLDASEAVAGANRRGRRDWAIAATAGAVVLAAWSYGVWRRGAGDFPLGPRVGLIQGNFPASIRDDRPEWNEIYRIHHHLTGLTVPYKPDIIVWPEAMFRFPMWQYQSGMTTADLERVADDIPPEAWRHTQPQERMADIADMTNAALVLGVSVFAAVPDKYFVYNSAAFVQPGAGVTDRYDKIHRVPFGEYIPLQESLPGLQSLTPFRGKFGIDEGQRAVSFRYKDWRLIPLICFEDTVPQLVASLTRAAQDRNRPGAEVLVNLTNDGWFHGSSELEQHLITAAFRCVETRTPMVRAVNTGVSALIDGDGVVREPVEFIDLDAEVNNDPPRTTLRDSRTGRYHKQLNCAQVVDVPLDPRGSFYLMTGDWFGAGGLVVCVAFALQGLFLSRRRAEAELTGAS